MARKGITVSVPTAASASKGAPATGGMHSASATSTGDVVLEWDAATVTTMTQLRAAVAELLRTLGGTTLLTP